MKFTLTELFGSPIYTYLNELQNFCTNVDYSYGFLHLHSDSCLMISWLVEEIFRNLAAVVFREMEHEACEWHNNSSILIKIDVSNYI